MNTQTDTKILPLTKDHQRSILGGTTGPVNPVGPPPPDAPMTTSTSGSGG